MWTPKRLLLLMVGFLFFFMCYSIYDHFLGRYDGLPPLPSEYRPVAGGPEAFEPLPPPPPSRAVARLIEAFGPNCVEKDRAYKIEWQAQDLVLAFNEWKLLPNGRLLLVQVSVAVFGQSQADDRRDINSLRGDEAEVEFDRPVKDLRDASRSKPVAGTLRGNVLVTNNRGTKDASDDLRLTTSALSYRDDQHRIWSEERVRILDGDPAQATIHAEGMEVLLVAQTTLPAAKTPAKPGKDSRTIQGVRVARLDRNIRMEFTLDANSTFMASAKTPPAGQGRKSPVVVEAAGPFLYHVADERAEFNDRVKVLRQHEPAVGAKDPTPKFDQLECEQLVLQFVRAKTEKATASSPASAPQELTLATARATGKRVELISDGDGHQPLRAIGADMLYDRAANETTLRGKPDLFAELQGHELRMQGHLVLAHPAPGSQELQGARAFGRGEIRAALAGKDGAATPPPPFVARWSREMRWQRRPAEEHLTFKGVAEFVHAEWGQLQGDIIEVWLDRQDAQAQAGEQRVAPRRLEAKGGIKLTSRDLVIPRADSLTLLFVAHGPAEADPNVKPMDAPAPKAAGAGAPAAASPLTQDSPAAAPAKRPLELRAEAIEATLLRRESAAGGKDRTNAIQAVDAFGGVTVRQEPTLPTDKRLDIAADRLQLRQTTDGAIIDLYGKGDAWAKAELDRFFLSGPELHLDQNQNVVQVSGAGLLRMPTSSSLDGEKLRDAALVEVTWTRRMLFNGKTADFFGDVRAEQKPSYLRCGEMQVCLDRHVSLRPRPAGDAPAAKEPAPNIAMVLCYKDVVMEKHGNPGVVDIQRISGQEAVLNNAEGKLHVQGYGQCNLLRSQMGQGPAIFPGGGPASNPGGTARTMLTRIHFDGHMIAYKTNSRIQFTSRSGTATRSGIGVQVQHLPSDTIDLAIKPDAMPPGAIYITCGELKGQSRRVDSQRSVQEFEATGQVYLQVQQEISAVADLLKYDEQKDWLILEGLNNNLARIYRQTRRGADRNELASRKIIYNIKEKTYQSIDNDAINFRP